MPPWNSLPVADNKPGEPIPREFASHNRGNNKPAIRAVSRRRMLQLLGTAAGLLGDWGCAKESSGNLCVDTGGRIQWIVPFAGGGGYDVYSRLLEPHLSRRLGVEIAVNNIPGGGGTVAANTLVNSRADGSTLGILNAPGLLAGSMTGEPNVPNPATDFSILGRITRSRTVVLTGARSGFRHIDDVLLEARNRPILAAISEVGSTTFVSLAVTAELLAINTEFVSGYSGSRESGLAVMRGDVDLFASTFESALDRIESDDLHPLLQISVERLSEHPSLDGIPVLGGHGGLGARRAADLDRNVERTVEDAALLVSVINAGIMVAGPPRMPPNISRCLEEELHETMTDPDFELAAARARRILDIATADESRAEIAAASTNVLRLMPAVNRAVARLRS